MASEPCGILFADGPQRVCGEPSAGAYQGTCDRGHVSERPLCARHAEVAHECATCFYSGDSSPVTLTLLDRAAMPGQAARAVPGQAARAVPGASSRG